MNLRTEPGWSGLFTREQAEGAYPNGTRIEKIGSEPSDAHRDGAQATVLGSIRGGDLLAYFVEWDDLPREAVVLAPHRARRLP